MFIDEAMTGTLPRLLSHRPVCIQPSTYSGIRIWLLDPWKWDRNVGTQVPA
jgi:hypothetical protein